MKHMKLTWKLGIAAIAALGLSVMPASFKVPSIGTVEAYADPGSSTTATDLGEATLYFSGATDANHTINAYRDFSKIEGEELKTLLAPIRLTNAQGDIITDEVAVSISNRASDGKTLTIEVTATSTGDTAKVSGKKTGITVTNGTGTLTGDDIEVAEATFTGKAIEPSVTVT